MEWNIEIKKKKRGRGVYAYLKKALISGLNRYHSIIMLIIVPMGMLSKPIIANIIATILAHPAPFSRPKPIMKYTSASIPNMAQHNAPAANISPSASSTPGSDNIEARHTDTIIGTISINIPCMK